MTTKALFEAAWGDVLFPTGKSIEFTRTAANILTVTGHGLETGAGPYKVRTNIGDAPAGLTANVRASGTLTATTAVATNTVTIAGKVYTFEAAPAADGDVDVTIVDAHDMANLAHAINQNVDAAASTYDLDTVLNPTVFAELTSMGALGAVAVLTIYAKTLDATLGNAITLVSGQGTIVASGATLAGGIDGGDYFIIRLDADTFSLATTRALALAGTVVAITDAGTGIHTLVPTIETLSDALNDVVVNVLTRYGNKSATAAFNIAKFWQSAIDGTANGDEG